MGPWDYAIIGIFWIVIFWMGSYFYKWVGNVDDFQVVGRSLTPFILAATMISTNMNLYNFIGEAGSTYQYGISVIWHEWTGNMALIFSGLFVIPIMRRLRIRTIPEYLEMRFGKSVRSLVGVLWIVRICFWLGVVLYTGVTLFQVITPLKSFTLWVLIFALITIVYTSLGGMWAVSMMHVIEFLLMLGGCLILVPIAMKNIGWFPGLIKQLPPHHLDIIAQSGPFNWQFTLAIFLLGLQWASTDQGMLQASFGAKDTKTVAKGMVFGGIALTAFNILIFLPGLISRVIHPGLSNFDMAVPTLLASQLPVGVLGLVICGLLASQLSTIDANLAAVSTLFTNDVYESILKRKPSPKRLLQIVRLTTIIGGLMMIFFAYMVPRMGGAVNAYLTLIGIMDMPLFVIAIVYGLLWKKTTEKGALFGYLSGAIVGAIACFVFKLNSNITTFISTGVALIVCPVISIFTRQVGQDKIKKIWEAKRTSEEEQVSGEVYHIIPQSIKGKISLGVLAIGLIGFIVGAFMGKYNTVLAGSIAVGGMLIYFLGGILRLYSE